MFGMNANTDTFMSVSAVFRTSLFLLRFGNAESESLTLHHLPLRQANARGEQSRLYYLGFIGESRVLKKEANEPMTST